MRVLRPCAALVVALSLMSTVGQPGRAAASEPPGPPGVTGVAPAQVAAATQTLNMVIIGDSYSAGNGARDKDGHRSYVGPDRARPRLRAHRHPGGCLVGRDGVGVGSASRRLGMGAAWTRGV